ncbi:MAG: heat-inducible transcriptional repressor HrcA [Candidatus Promineifilaceae bacterium]|nr:heat-inducible transcriptional repressor HrcA [Candidatus Promineifilaceae bacterium]
MLHPLSDRQEAVLRLVVRTYVETGQPVGSRTLVEQYDLDVSSATVRNELSALGDLGYLMQQHTSAGRVPTELGYRYFVQKLLGEFHLPVHEQQMIRHQFHQARLDINQWVQLAAAILARASRSASFVTAPYARANRFKHLQLISTQGRLVLMVLVLHSGEIKQQMLTLAEPLPQVRLSMGAEHLNELYKDATYEEVKQHLNQLDTLEYEVTKLVMDILIRSDNRSISDIYRDGLVNLMEHEGTRQAIRVLEERTLLANVISHALVPESSGVQVVIGGEGRWEELKDCTVIMARYGVPDDFSGTVAVIGPTRMSYGRNVAAVRYVADLMSGFVYDYYADPYRREILDGEEVTSD